MRSATETVETLMHDGTVHTPPALHVEDTHPSQYTEPARASAATQAAHSGGGGIHPTYILYVYSKNAAFQCGLLVACSGRALGVHRLCAVTLVRLLLHRRHGIVSQSVELGAV